MTLGELLDITTVDTKINIDIIDSKRIKRNLISDYSMRIKNDFNIWILNENQNQFISEYRKYRVLGQYVKNEYLKILIKED